MAVEDGKEGLRAWRIIGRDGHARAVEAPAHAYTGPTPLALAHWWRSPAAALAWVIAPLAVLLAVTAWCGFWGIDSAVAGWFYSSAENSWPLAESTACILMYEYGCLPGLFVGSLSLAVLGLGVFWNRLRAYQPGAVYLALALLLGPGLIVNGLLKPHWGRPRPKQVVEFGGDAQFSPVWKVNDRPDRRSFACGHASMGFFLFAPALLLIRRRPMAAAAMLAVGLAAGGVIGLGRMAQGAHFLTDVLWSAALVYFASLAVYPLYVWWSGARSRTILRLPAPAPAIGTGVDSGKRAA